MNLQQIITNYAPLAWRTVNTALEGASIISMCSHGITGELGEYYESKEQQEERTLLLLELGDICWYVASFLTQIEMTSVLSEEIALEDVSILAAYREAARINEWAKKVCYHYKSLEIAPVVASCEILLEYVANEAITYGSCLEEVLSMNIAKLKERHPKKFSVEYMR